MTVLGSIYPELPINRQRGSKPRCHHLTDGSRSQVATRLSLLIAPWGVVRSTDHWMPEGFKSREEAQLHLATALLSRKEDRDRIRDWWLAEPKGNTPNFDLASTCLVGGQEGLLLVEAKAHDYELRKEEKGKQLAAGMSAASRLNHAQIGAAIAEANGCLTQETGGAWSLSRDRCYQMSNRFASAWKVTEIGMPVILVYLGFTACEEMRNGLEKRPIASNHDWKELVFAHRTRLFPSSVWNREWTVTGKPFVPLIRTFYQGLRQG